MASNDVEILDPAATIEKPTPTVSEPLLDRRFFLAALGVAAAGSALVSGTSARAQQPKPSGYNQVDILNLLLNIKYLKATLYSFVTQGTDLPIASGVTVNTGQIYNQPAKITFSGSTAAQLTDMYNEMYFDELNNVLDLRNQIGSPVIGRPTINILGTGTTTTVTTTLTQSQFIAMSRMLEDASASAFAGALIYLTGANLTLASQILATDGFHAGAVRLASIQTGAQYQSPAYTAVTFTGVPVTGSNSMYAIFGTTPPAVGQVVTGFGMPTGAGAVITGVTTTASIVGTAITTKTTTLNNVTTTGKTPTTAGAIINQPVTGTNIAANSYITAVGGTTLTLSVAASGSSTVAPTGIVTTGSNIVNNVSSVTGIAVGQPITGTGIPASTTVTAVSATTANPLTITMSAPATATSTVKPTGVLTLGSPTITAVSSISGVTVGQAISGTGIPANTFVGKVGTNSIDMVDGSGNPVNATANSTKTTAVTFSAFTVAGSKDVTPNNSTNALVVGQGVTGTGIPAGTTITAIGASTVTLSNAATATSTASPTGITYQGSTLITAVSSVTGLVVGQPITGPGIPAGATITALSATTANPITITLSTAATATVTSGVTLSTPVPVTLSSTTGPALTITSTETVTIPTTGTLTIGQSIVTLAGNATATGSATISVLQQDPLDVVPADQGTAALAAAGPQLLAGTSAAPQYQGFFNTAGSETSSGSSPAGSAFARNPSQLLQVLLNANPSNTTNSTGGFFPVGVNGTITAVV